MNSKVTRGLGCFAFPCRCAATTRATISKLAKKGRVLFPAAAAVAAPPRSHCGCYLAPAQCVSSGTFLVLNLVINEADYFILTLPVVETEAIN